MAESRVGARQVGRRATIVCAALVVSPTSTIFTPQELAHQPVALDYGNGTAYAGLQMLEGAMPREAVTTCAAAQCRFGSSTTMRSFALGGADTTAVGPTGWRGLALCGSAPAGGSGMFRSCVVRGPFVGSSQGRDCLCRCLGIQHIRQGYWCGLRMTQHADLFSTSILI